ncbi:uncharacterized protein LOC142629022 [Castanea sativa]|uniref:uncharacterized protein LOC142629022 n=1 Tax=Castanea sativa TaxID=21020 RepID=UPI003F65047F
MRMAQEMQMMKEKMDIMMNAMKGRVSANLDELVHRTGSLFIAEITSFPLPAKFRKSQVETYDGSRDPFDHLESFKILMHLQGALDEIMCRAFPTTLKGPARVWFNKLTPNIVSTFKELSGHFVTHFIEGQRHRRSFVAILNIKQREDESLRSYVTHFNKEALLIDEASNKVLITSFTSGLKRGEFLFSIYKNDLKTMAKALYKATKYMNVEDAMIARGDGPSKRERQDDPCLDRGRKTTRTNDKRDDRRSRPPSGRTTNFTALNALLDQVLMQIRDDVMLTWLDKLKGDPNKRPRNKYCRFHRDHGHKTFKCYDLKQ